MPAPAAVGHRIVHSGPHLTGHTLIDARVRALLADVTDLAPLHVTPAPDLVSRQVERLHPTRPTAPVHLIVFLTFALSCRVQRESGFGEAPVDEVGSSLDAAQASADGSGEAVAVGEDDVDCDAAPQQRPDPSDRVGDGCAGGQLHDGEPVVLGRVLP
ncbi:hypothetical protein ACFW2D_28625 [Streptomyces sp. NPDC058914]|uniref:hypothetical protein n=1 Tax=Streptomyces sp. NPDC058914 TaxID=3346671 RepID=UPI00369B1351